MAKPGEIVRIKSLHGTKIRGAWGVGTKEVIYYGRLCVYVLIPGDSTIFKSMRTNGTDPGWLLDDFEVVPEADVPDEVWTALAKEALLGELTKC